MKRNLLVCTSGVSLLYLLAGFSTLEALAVEKISNSQAINSSEKLTANKVLSQENFPSANTIISEKVNNQLPFDAGSHYLGEYGTLTTKKTVAPKKKENAIREVRPFERIAQVNKQLNKK